ncbi:MAG: membrane dipeptidase [Phycisphaerales bacterium]|jgi:membrane dipeptidase
MKWIDGHLDLAYLEVHGRNLYEECCAAEEKCISLPDIEQSHVATIFGTICTYPKEGPCGYVDSTDVDAAFQAGVEQLEIYKRLEREGNIRIQHSGCTLDETLSTLILMEGSDPIRNAGDVVWWRSQGLRLAGLTWAIGTRYAGGNATGGPLTDEGIDVVSAFDESGIVHDASHLSDESFEGLVQHAKGVIVASHSNSRTVLGNDSERHLLDEQAKAIFESGGVIGLNLCNQFLSKTFSKTQTTATIADCVEHVLHFCNLAGNKRQVALGSDFDGGFPTEFLPTNLKHPNHLHHLAEGLKQAGFEEEDLESFAFGAWQKVFA